MRDAEVFGDLPERLAVRVFFQRAGDNVMPRMDCSLLVCPHETAKYPFCSELQALINTIHAVSLSLPWLRTRRAVKGCRDNSRSKPLLDRQCIRCCHFPLWPTHDPGEVLPAIPRSIAVCACGQVANKSAWLAVVVELTDALLCGFWRGLAFMPVGAAWARSVVLKGLRTVWTELVLFHQVSFGG